MGLDDLFFNFVFNEEFVFPEHGGVLGGYERNCPHCGVQLWLEVTGESTVVSYTCDECHGAFEVDWDQEFWG